MGDLSRIGLVMGDPSGIGPEVALKAASHMVEEGRSAPVLIGSKEVFNRDMKMCGLRDQLVPLESSAEPQAIYLVESVDRRAGPFPYGRLSAESGAQHMIPS